MTKTIRKRIIPQMHDVRPIDVDGNFDFSRINNIRNFSEKGGAKVVARKESSKDKVRHEMRRSIVANTGDIRVSPKSVGDSRDFSEARRSLWAEAEKNGNVFGGNSQGLLDVQSGNAHSENNSDDSIFVPKFQSIPEGEKTARVYQFGQIFEAEDVPMFHQAVPVVKKIPASSEKNISRIKAPAFPKEEKGSFSERYQFGQRIDFDRNQEVSQLEENSSLIQDALVAEIELARNRVNERENIVPKKKQKEVNPSFARKLQQADAMRIESRWNFAESLEKMFSLVNLRKQTLSFSGVAIGIFLIIISIGFFNKGLKIRDTILGTGKDAYFNLALAKDGMMSRDFQKSSFAFSEASGKFEVISRDINDLAGIIVPTSRYIPYLSKLSSGDNIAQAGKNVSRIGILVGEIMQTMETVKNPLDKTSESVSFLEIFKKTDKNLREILTLVEETEKNLAKVNVDDIPQEQRVQFVELRGKLPEIKDFMRSFLESSEIMTDVLGGNGPRKYLFLFQNNQEMRATGGFIGTYGVLDIFNGHVRNFFIDGIYNPDGQLREKVVPPVPIQKMSANWSLHDSNWFPDFPKSAEKAAWFYEKTGGPTVDGVITMTPNVMQRMLEVTGPIEMPEYGVTVDSRNFIETVQQEVEVDYDKKVNQPKKILADLAPKILDRIFNAKNISDMTKTMKILMESLNEKQILIYSKNYDVEKLLSQEGWSGEVLKTEKDYLSVINTNINGYKTDGVIDESISHQAEIQSDGSIVNTVTITRHHNGGSLEKDWWNRVNANYMRVYVPKGSKLLSAEGQTREFNSPPLDYKKLGFKWDAQLLQEEDSMQIDQESGTRVYEDSDKTVFANWVYVSPQETVIMKYTYLLPFRVDMGMAEKPADTYSLLAQKQSGSIGSKFSSTVTYPQSLQMIWSYPENAKKEDGKIAIETELKEDKFLGTAFTLK